MSKSKWIVLIIVLLSVATFALYEYRLQSARSSMSDAIESSRDKSAEMEADYKANVDY